MILLKWSMSVTKLVNPVTFKSSNII